MKFSLILKYGFFGLIFIFASLITACGNQSSAEIGNNAPQISAKQLDGQKLDTAQTEGKTVVLAFFKNGCASCIKSLPQLNEMAKEQPNKLAVLAIDALDTPEVIADMARRFGWDNMTMLKDDLAITSKRFGVVVTPTVIILDNKGIIQARIIGERPWETTEAALKKVLQNTNI